MANMHDSAKERITFACFSDDVDELTEMAKDLSEAEGREVTISELMREHVLLLANARRKALGKKTKNHDVVTGTGGNPHTRRGIKAA